MAQTITFGNAKGGVGKTTNSVLTAYVLAERGYKTLVVDMDPQANATNLLLKTAQKEQDALITFEKTLMAAIKDNDLDSIITSVNKNLSLLPSFADFAFFPKYLQQMEIPEKDQGQIFKRLLRPFQDQFDFIIIDTPPTLSDFTDNACLAADWIVIVMQTQERSFDGAVGYIKYLNQLIENYGLDVAEFDILGVLPVLLKSTSNIDKNIIKRAQDTFGEANLLKTVVKPMERLKRYDISGIENPKRTYGVNKYHNQQVFDTYEAIADEIIKILEEKGAI